MYYVRMKLQKVYSWNFVIKIMVSLKLLKTATVSYALRTGRKLSRRKYAVFPKTNIQSTIKCDFFFQFDHLN